MDNKCGNCFHFFRLSTNPNFGKCKFPAIVKEVSYFVDYGSILSGTGYGMPEPIVHNESVYSCFLGESKDETAS